MKIIRLGNTAPKTYLKAEFGAEPTLQDVQPTFDTVTTITVSDSSTLLQSVSEVMSIWNLHSHNVQPNYIEYTFDAKTIALVLSGEFGGVEIREVAA